MLPITLDQITVGDKFQSQGDRHVSSVQGTVTKANRKTLEIETSYMGKPIQLKIRRDRLTGEVRVLRDGQMYSTAKANPAGGAHRRQGYGGQAGATLAGKPLPTEKRSAMPEDYYEKHSRLLRASRRDQGPAALRASRRLTQHENAFGSPRANPVNLGKIIWGDDTQLRKAFSWLTRIGVAPKFGSMPIAYYQQDQVKAIETIERLAKEKGFDPNEPLLLKYKNSRIYAQSGNQWIPIALIITGKILPA